MSLGKPIKVLIIDGDTAYRNALATIFNGTPGYACAGVFARAEQVLAKLDRAPADVVLVGISLPGITGIEFVRRYVHRFPQGLVIVLSDLEDEGRILEVIKAGATGYILKSTTPARILDAIQEVKNGGAPISPSIALKLVRRLQRVRESDGQVESLTPRETEVLEQLAAGKSVKALAALFSISTQTVHSHLKNIYEKLGVHSRLEAVLKYQRYR